MKKQLMALVALLAALTMSGCNAAWFQALRSNIVVAAQDGVSYIRTALSMARGAFEVWAATDPEGTAAIRARFNELTAQVDRGLIVAQDGLRLAAHIGGPAPDLNELLREAQQAIGSIHAFLAGLPGNGPGRASSPTMREALEATAQASRPIAY